MRSADDLGDSLGDLTAALRDFARARDWERLHTPKNLATALAGEAGELVACFQWLTPEESARVIDDPGIAARRPGGEMAGQLLQRFSGGKTLHQLRHSRLTHLGDQTSALPCSWPSAATNGHSIMKTEVRKAP